MQLSLAAISPNILDSILGFLYSQSALDLWLCGDKLLQSRLSQGLTSIHLLNAQKFALNRFPKIVTYLPKLRSLVIDRQFYTLWFDQDVSIRLRSLPPTLTKLVLRYEISDSALFPEPATLSSLYPLPGSNGNEGNVWCLRTAFPLLETLEAVVNELCIDWSTLPPHLTSLVTKLSSDPEEHDHFFRCLPRQLLHLTLYGAPMDPSCWVHLPPTLISFDCARERINGNGGEELALLPRSLTKLILPETYEVKSPHHLPPGLVDICQYEMNKLDSILETKGPMFPSLTQITLPSLYSATPRPLIRNLPQSVTNICITLDLATLEKEDWPCNLKTLDLCYSCNFHAPALPTGLQSLYLGTMTVDLSAIALLPRSLTELSASLSPCDHQQPVAFPPQLKVLTLFGHHQNFAAFRKETPKCFALDSLPRSLTSLKMAMPLFSSKIRHLPHLLNLEISALFEDSDYDSQKELHWARTCQTHRMSHIAEKFDWDRLSEATLALLLPRSLTRFAISGHSAQPSLGSFDHLPPLITNLTLKSPLLELHEWQSIMKLPLRELDVSIRSLDDLHCSFLPKSITYLCIMAQTVSELTFRGILYLSPNVDFSLKHQNAQEIRNMREHFRRLFSRFQHNDAATFFKLLNARDNVDFCLNLLGQGTRALL